MLIETNWLNILVDRGEKNVTSFKLAKCDLATAHLGIIFIEGDVLFHGATALVEKGLLIIEASRSHSDTPHSVGLLWTSGQPDAGTATYTSLAIDFHTPGRTRTHNPRKREAADPRVRPCGHWDRHC
jgi:hypothetical protein